MIFKKTNLHEKLLRVRRRSSGSADILEQVRQILDAHQEEENRIDAALKTPDHPAGNHFDFDLLNSDRIFHEDTIKKICIDYRLRFLSTHYFKGSIPREAYTEIKEMESSHAIELSGFKIIAPSKMFVLHKTDDPLLFAPMGNGYFYLIHKWGRDLHPLRKWMMWPFKSFENLLFAILLSSIVATMMIPDGLFTKHQSFSQDIMVFFFMFKSIAAVVLFYGFACGKNFNTEIWKSKYDKSQ